MNVFIRLVIIGLLGVLAVHQPICYAKIVTKNGVTLNKTETRNKQFIYAAIQTDNNCGTSTATYNDAGESAISSGAINVAGYNDAILIQMEVSTLGSTGVNYLIEGSTEVKIANWGEIDTVSFDAVTTKDYILPILEGALKWIRVGTQATGTEGTDSVSSKIMAEGSK